MRKRILAILLAMVMIVGLLPTVAMAATPVSIRTYDDIGTTDANVALALAQMLLGDDVEIIPGSANLTYMDKAQVAAFSNGTDPLGIDSGVMLSTGDAYADFNSSATDSDYGENYDSDLAALINQEGQTYGGDTVALQFSMVATGEMFNFDYSFASAEFDQEAEFNDIFGLFVKVNDGAFENIALLDSGKYVTITNLRTDSVKNPSGGEIDTSLELTYARTDMSESKSYFNGYSNVFTAQKSVNIGDTVTIKFVIADVGDQSFDSAVFIRGGSLSFTSAKNPLTTPDGSVELELSEGLTDPAKLVVKLNGAELVQGTDYTVDLTDQMAPVIKFNSPDGLDSNSTITVEITLSDGTQKVNIANNIPGEGGGEGGTTPPTTPPAGATGPVFIDYTEGSMTDVSWDGKSDITISNPAIIYIVDNYEQSKTMTIAANVTIDGNGKTVTVTNPKAAFTLNNDAVAAMSNVVITRTNGSATDNLIQVEDAKLTCNSVYISDARLGGFAIYNGSTLTMAGSANKVESSSADTAMFVNKGGIVNIEGGTYNSFGLGQIVGNFDGNSIVNISGGTFYNESGSYDTIVNGQINMSGGTIISKTSAAIRSGSSTDKIQITGGTIKDSKYAIKVGKDSATPGGSVTIGSGVTFVGNTTDVYLATKTAKITLGANFATPITVQSGVALGTNEKRPITTTGATLDMTDYVTAAKSGQAVSYDDAEKCLYLWSHTHNFAYTGKDKDYHWDACTICSAIQDKEEHAFTIESENASEHWKVCADCGQETGRVPHTYTILVSSDASTHTYRCDNPYCSDVRKITENHSYTEMVVNNAYHVSDATCDNPAVYSLSCICGKSGGTTYTFNHGAALGHDWGTATYSFAEDGSSCTATRVCTRDSSHTETATATITSAVTIPAKCEVKGTTTYTATFAEAWATEQKKDVQDIPALTHIWGTATYSFAADGKSCTATRVCTRDNTHTETANATITSDVKTDPTCTVDGWTTYTATFDVSWATEQKKDVQDIPATDHAWTVTYDFAADGKSCTATHVCGNDATHNVTIDATISSTVKTPAKCEEMGTTTYTAFFAESWATTQKKDVVDIPVLNHDWKDTTYSFAANGSACTATRVCKHDNTHVETATATITSAVKTDPTCLVDGWTTYTATFAESWATVQTKDVQDIPATDHDWEVSAYTWTQESGAWYCTASYVCKNDANHFGSEKVMARGTVTTPAQCEVMGTTTYTATFTAAWAETQTKAVQDVPVLNHDWTVEYDFADNGSSCTATRVCGNDAAHNVTINATVTNAVTNPATCTEMGTTTYTATFAEDWAQTQTKAVVDIPAKQHAWTVTYNFAADGSSCTATHVCGNDANHNVTINATITSAVKTPAKCEAMGTTTYTATFTEDWAQTQTKDVVDIPVLNHAWTVEYEWVKKDDGWYCTAKRICGNDAAHNQAEEVKATGAVKTEPDCEVDGWTTYTATFTADWATEQTKDVQDIPALTHDWATTWSSNATDHWHDCLRENCDAVNDKEAHTASSWIIDSYAKVGVEGEKHKECTVCERILATAKIPAIPYPVIDVNPGTNNSGNSVSNCPKDATCPVQDYVDLDDTAWYHDGVHYCIENGLMYGVGNNLFAPNGVTTRAQIITILWRLEGEPLVPAAEGFNDVFDSDWYNNAVRWASANRIAEGYGDSVFAPNDPITREQLASILWRYAKYKGIDVSVGENTNILSYADAFGVSSWAMEAMQWACGSGMIHGMAMNNTMYLAPKGDAVRSQSATMIYYFCTEIKE